MKQKNIWWNSNSNTYLKHCHWPVVEFNKIFLKVSLKILFWKIQLLFLLLHSGVVQICFCRDFIFEVLWKSFDLKIAPHPSHLARFAHIWIYLKPSKTKSLKLQMQFHLLWAPANSEVEENKNYTGIFQKNRKLAKDI